MSVPGRDTGTSGAAGHFAKQVQDRDRVTGTSLVMRIRRFCASRPASGSISRGRPAAVRVPLGRRRPAPEPDPRGVGRRVHCLDVDPQTAPLVQWIFARRLAGASAASIARVLNERRVPSPAAHDPVRNPHRVATVWTWRTVAAILANPRYTGRQVWNRQRTNHHETVPGDKRSSLGITRDWNPRSDWVISARRTHPALVSDADFLAAQQITAIPMPADSRARRYRLTGLLVCGLCGRRLEAQWVHGRPGYRCRHGHTSARQPDERLRAIYWPEHRIMTETLHQLRVAGLLPPAAGPTELVGHLHARDAVIVRAAAQFHIDEYTESFGPSENLSGIAPMQRNGRVPAQRQIQETPTTSIPEGMNLVGVNLSEDRHKPIIHQS